MEVKDNKIIFEIDQQFQGLFKKIISSVLINYKNIPLEWQDIYYPFLARVPEFLNNFKKHNLNNIPIHTYLGICCKNYARNLARKYNGNRFKILNRAINDEKILLNIKDPNSIVLEDTNKEVYNGVLFKDLTNEHRIFYNLYFVKNYSLKQIFEEMGITRYKLSKLKKELFLFLISENMIK